MKRILLLIGCLPFLLASCRQEKTATTLRFNVSDYDGNAPRVIIGWDNQSVAIDSAGKGALTLDLKAPTYATVEVRKYDRRLCYLEPGKDLSLSYSMKKGEKAVTFDGALAPENRFIYQNDYLPYRLDYQERNPQKNVRTIDSVLAVNLQKVAESDQSATFKEWESKRIQVEALNALMRVPLMNAPDHVKLLTERINRDSTYLSIPAYREALDQYIRKCVSADRQGGRIPEGAGLADIRMKYILENISEPAARSYLVDITLFHFGEQGIERYDRLYNQYVTDPERLALYAEACKKAERIAPGQPCPDFRFADNHGDTVTLADLKGKYVYIDMWATWCGPCKGEMPSLLKLEEEFAGEDILFVSLSIDRNKDIDLWKKTIEEMGLGGIQLHLGENWEWLKIFMPASMSVPRFVLLDREGKFINSSMTRPSDKATAEKFRELLNNEK